MNIKDYKFIVVGSGFWGSVIAERLANDLGQRVLVIEKKSHWGGNSYSAIDPETGIECHKYGSHVFHTPHRHVWDYICRFTTFNSYRHKVLIRYKNKIFPMPINLATINSFYGKTFNPQEAEEFIRQEARKEHIEIPDSMEEMALSLVGRPLYEAFIRSYSLKHWKKEPKYLPASVITRLPIRFNFSSDYFDDPYQGIPSQGYGKIFERMLASPEIEVMLDTDYFDIRDQVPKGALVIYSGAIDAFFDYKYGPLRWLRLEFEREVHKTDDVQGTAVMNYADADIPYTRVHEFKHLHPERYPEHQGITTIFREYSKEAQPGDDLYYAVNSWEDQNKFRLYQEEQSRLEGVILGGRLGAYKYFDMDDAINDALNIYENRIKKENPCISAQHRFSRVS